MHTTHFVSKDDHYTVEISGKAEGWYAPPFLTPSYYSMSIPTMQVIYKLKTRVVNTPLSHPG